MCRPWVPHTPSGGFHTMSTNTRHSAYVFVALASNMEFWSQSRSFHGKLEIFYRKMWTDSTKHEFGAHILDKTGKYLEDCCEILKKKKFVLEKVHCKISIKCQTHSWDYCTNFHLKLQKLQKKDKHSHHLTHFIPHGSEKAFFLLEFCFSFTFIHFCSLFSKWVSRMISAYVTMVRISNRTCISNRIRHGADVLVINRLQWIASNASNRADCILDLVILVVTFLWIGRLNNNQSNQCVQSILSE